MEELTTRNESIALYRYMCENIVGSEEQVKTIRMMNTIRDNLQSNAKCTRITSGSFGEGLAMKGSDLDIMHVIKGIEVCEDTKIRGKHETSYFVMQIEDSQPGFVQLQLVNTNDQIIRNGCEKIGYDYYYSSFLFKKRFADNTFVTVHGPCLSDERGIVDVAYCLHSKSWVTPAKQWITRSNHSRPMSEVKQTILKHGVLFVPIGVKGSMKEDLGWRISFSIAEKFLIFTFTHTQLLCYALVKILLKDVIASVLNVSDLLCSYFMKTVMFWISEELSTSIWKPEHLISCFMICFRRLIYYVQFSVCPHYFIPSNNLFENKINGLVQEMLLYTLNSLDSYGWQCILFSEQISNLDTLTYDIINESRFSKVRSVKALSCQMINFADNLSWNTIVNLEKGIHRVLSIKSSKIKSIYTYYISRLYLYRSHQILQSGYIFDNKSTYKQYNTCISTLLLSTCHDAVSGWLLLASFFYNKKEYKNADVIIQYCLLKCTPQKLYLGINWTHINDELSSLHLLKMSSVQLYKFLVIDSLILPSSSELIPNELRIEVDLTHEPHVHVLTPVVYAHFLRYLCHYHLNNNRRYLDSIRQNLKLTIDESYLIANDFLKAISYNMLGITFELIGDSESATQAFMQSLELHPGPVVNDASRRLRMIGKTLMK